MAGAISNDLEVPSSAFFYNSCAFLLTHITSQIKLLKLHFYDS